MNTLIPNRDCKACFSSPLFEANEVCPELHNNEMHTLFDKNHKVLLFVIGHQNSHIIFSVKYEAK